MLRLSVESRRDFTVGEKANLMTIDIGKCQNLVVHLHLIWSESLIFIISLGYLYNIMGWSTIAGLLVLLLLLPFNIYVYAKQKFIHSMQVVHKDSRYKVIKEILAGITTLKVYAWEECFIAKVMGYRKEELAQLKYAMHLRSGHAFIVTLTPFIVSIAIFSVYILTGNELTAKKAFVAISLLNIMHYCLAILPNVTSALIQYKVSVKRLSKFLKGDELICTHETKQDTRKNAIEVINGTFMWTNVDEPVLKNINFQVPSGSLTAVVGQVGTGKSSLLSSMLGEIKKLNGEVFMQGSVAYVCQEAWIQNKTLRDNILFGKIYNKEKYNMDIQACALETDLDVLSRGDITEVGDKGINLSGGQKQRISLARAVYNNADIYLLDDPLSAVDAKVAKHIFDNVIGRNGLLKNQVEFLILTCYLSNRALNVKLYGIYDSF